MDDKALAIVSEERSVAEVSQQVLKIQELMGAVMKKDEHYGIIPGTGKKPSLLKPGAEKLCFVFRLAPEFEVSRDDLPNGHREYRIVCRLRSMSSGTIVGEGVGSCSTMESKYRYRNSSDYEITGEPIPPDSKERKAEYRKQGYGMKQVDGQWVWVRYKSEGKVENTDIADVYNTVLKMAKKRAHVDATITACAASDIFTQDVEDLPRASEPEEEEPRNVTPPAPQPNLEDLRKKMLALDKELGEIMTSSVGAVAAFSGEAKAEARKARAEIVKVGPDEAAKLAELVQTYRSRRDALCMAYGSAGSPTPRPAVLKPKEEQGIKYEKLA
jgi:hypothetical protein